MIQISPQVKVWIWPDAIDFRVGIDGLSTLCREKFLKNPFSGNFFVFINKPRTSIKCLVYDGQGYWLMQKRLSQGRFKCWPPEANSYDAKYVQVLLYNGNPDATGFQNEWRPLSE